MNQKVIILPSVMCCTPAEMEPYVRGFEEGGVDAIHFDVMDGHYVPNIMMGVRDYQFLKSITDMPVDIHLMCTEPEMFLEYLKPQPKDWVSFHPEVARNPYRFLMSIRERGCRAGIVLSPGEPGYGSESGLRGTEDGAGSSGEAETYPGNHRSLR